MKYAEYEKRCSDCFALVEGDHGEWWCDECDECCENVIDCPEGLSGAAMKITIEAFRFNKNQIDIMVSDKPTHKVLMRDYADNEKDAFTLMCKIYNKLWETYGTADLEEVTMMLYDETEG